MNVTLPPDLERLVAEKIEAGLYESPSDMVAQGLALLVKNEDAKAAARAKFDAMIQVGLDQLDRGESIEWSAVRDDLTARIRAHRR